MRKLRNAGRGLRATAVGLALVAAAGAMDSVRAQSLADAMVTAYKNSPELAAARADVKIQSELAVQARAGGRLQVNAQLRAQALTRTNTSITSGSSGTTSTLEVPNFPTAATLSFVQPLYTGGQVENSTEAAETRISAQEAVRLATEEQVLLDTVTAYADVLRDEELVSISRNNVRVLNEQLRAAQERFEVGEVTRTDVEQARARLAAARSRLAASTGALAIGRESYLRVVGEYPGDLQPLPPLPELPETIEQAVAIALREDPSVVAARLERMAASSDVRAAIGALLPQVTLEASLSRLQTFNDGENRDSDFRDREEAIVGLFVDIPIYTGGFNYSNVREAQAAAEAASANINSSMRQAIRNTGVSWARLDVARASIRAGRLEVSAAQLAFEGVREEAKVGARTTLDVLDAEQEVLEARSRLAQSNRDEYVGAYSLLASIGKLTVDHLGLDVGVDETGESYYDSVRNRNFGYDRTDDTVWRLDWRP